MNTKIVYVLIFICFAGLVISGIVCINAGERVYKQSYDLSRELAHNKLLAPPGYTLVKDAYGQALLYFTLALGVLLFGALLPRIQSFNIGTGGISFTLAQLRENVDNLARQSNSLQQQLIGVGPAAGNNNRGLMAPENARPEEEVLRAESKKDGLTMQVMKSRRDNRLYQYKVVVERTDSARPLNELIVFQLPESFHVPNPSIVPVNGKAVLEFSSESDDFVISAGTYDGKVVLQQDLKTLK